MKEGLGGKFWTIVHWTNWRVVFPMTGAHQEGVASLVVDEIQARRPVQLLVTNFPTWELNHTVVAYDYRVSRGRRCGLHGLRPERSLRARHHHLRPTRRGASWPRASSTPKWAASAPSACTTGRSSEGRHGQPSSVARPHWYSHGLEPCRLLSARRPGGSRSSAAPRCALGAARLAGRLAARRLVAERAAGAGQSRPRAHRCAARGRPRARAPRETFANFAACFSRLPHHQSGRAGAALGLRGVRGREKITSTRPARRGAGSILLTAHLGNWEFARPAPRPAARPAHPHRAGGGTGRGSRALPSTGGRAAALRDPAARRHLPWGCSPRSGATRRWPCRATGLPASAATRWWSSSGLRRRSPSVPSCSRGPRARRWWPRIASWTPTTATASPSSRPSG